ncbi:MAG: DMT family transporter [Desulfovibrio sp.]|nr:DMT family transporter [Desulfovibrio sp.]
MAVLLLLTALTEVLFASNSLLCRTALGALGMSPLSYAALRSLSASAMLAVLCGMGFIRPKDGESVWHGAWRESSWTGAVCLFGYMIFFSVAYVNMPPAPGTLILFTCVQVCMIGWALLQGNRPDRRQTVGLAVAFAGLVALMSPGLTAPPLREAGFMAISGFAWGGYCICGHRVTSAALAAAGTFFRATLFGVISGAAALCFEVTPQISGMACAFASGAVSSAFGYTLWYAISSSYSLVGSSIVQLCVPVLTAAMAVPLLGEPVTLRFVFCACLILGGIGVAMGLCRSC